MINKFSYIIVLLLMFSSCKTTKTLGEVKGSSKKAIKTIISNYHKSKPDFSNMRGKMKGVYYDGEDRQSINISYRFQKDQALWMSARFAGLVEVAKMMITPTNIKFYEKLENTFFDGDFQFINNLLGLELNYNQLQNVLLGNAIQELNIKNTDLQIQEKYYQLHTNYDNDISQSLLINTKDFSLKQQSLQLDDKSIRVTYKSYQKVGQSTFPKEIVILAGDTEKEVEINLIYKNIRLEEKLSFPFKIPTHYTPIEIN